MDGQRLVVIGHLGFESVKTPIAERRSLGGSGYYTAILAELVDRNDVPMLEIAGRQGEPRTLGRRR